MTSFYVFIILILSVFCQFINIQSTSTTSILNGTTTTTEGSKTDQKPSEMTSESTISVNTISVNQSTTSAIDSNHPSKSSSKTRWLLLLVPLLIVAIVAVIGIIHYYRRQSPYRRCTQCWTRCKFRFLQNWRSRDEDADNIILQLEQPDIMPGRWPPRISFA